MKKLIKRTHIAAMLAAVMMFALGISAFATYETPTFTDVPKSYWGYTYIENAVEKGWLSGMGDGTFQPEGRVTVAQLSTMLTKAYFQDKLDAYSGPVDPWYMPYCVTADEVGLYEACPAKGKTNDALYMEQETHRVTMAVMIYNTMVALNANMPSAQEINEAKASTPDYNPNREHANAVYSVKAAGIITGMDDTGKFDPFGKMTRAQAAVVLTKLDEYLNKNGTSVDPGTEPEEPVTPTDGVYTTTAADVNGVKPNVGKNDLYPTKGRSANVNRNGYHTAADVDIGNAQLVYELLGMVNEARRAEGLNEVTWTTLDSFEEYTLLRAHEMAAVTGMSHIRPNEQCNYIDENAASGYTLANQTFNGWMNSPKHRGLILDEHKVTMCAARSGNFWVIVLGGIGAPALIENGSEVGYTENNGWYSGEAFW